MKPLLAGAFVLALAMVFISTPSDGLANHYTYMQENPTDQSRWSEVYPYNGVFSGWSWTPYPADWDDDGSFTQNIRAAISTWEQAVPELDFHESTDGLNYLWFQQGWCGINSDACFMVEEQDVSHNRRADYLLWADIHLTLAQPNIGDVGKEDQLRHEIGHWIGLDEAYCELCIDPCVRHVDSVMNATYLSNGRNCTGVHSPTTRDINAVTAYWNGDGLESPVLTERPNNVLKLTWTDALWAEFSHWIILLYWDDEDNDWVSVYNEGHKTDIGFHKNSIPRTMQKSWNLGAKGWPTDKKYIAGVWAWSWPYRSWTPAIWSNEVRLD